MEGWEGKCSISALWRWGGVLLITLHINTYWCCKCLFMCVCGCLFLPSREKLVVWVRGLQARGCGGIHGGEY